MILKYFKAIGARLKASVNEIDRVRLNTGNYLERKKQDAFDKLTCYIDFGELDWEDVGNGIQESEAIIEVHFLAELPLDVDDIEGLAIDKYDENFLGIVEKIEDALNKHTLKDDQGAKLSGTLTRKGIKIEPTGSEIGLCILKFKGRLIDNSGYTQRNMVEKQIDNLNVYKLP